MSAQTEDTADQDGELEPLVGDKSPDGRPKVDAAIDVDDDHSEKPVADAGDDPADDTALAKCAVTASWLANIFLLVVKLVLFIETGSRSILAALADSIVDILSQAILELADRYQTIHNAEYPVGRSRLEALSVLACGVIMAFANIEVIQASITTLAKGLNGDLPTFETHWYTYALLGLGIGIKFVLWRLCSWAQEKLSSDMMEALAEDHVNDVMSNAVAVITLTVAAEQTQSPNLWWVDATGAVAISFVIVFRWISVGNEQVEKIVGRTAPPEFITIVETIASSHDPRVIVDCTRAYHCGARFHVEMEIVLPGTMMLSETHDMALIVQHKIERLPEVERAFVHVDYEVRDGLEHKVERELLTGTDSLTSKVPAAAKNAFDRTLGGDSLTRPRENSDRGIIEDYADYATCTTARES